MGGSEQKFVNEAFSTNWIAPLGPNVDGFENDLKGYLGGAKHVAALSSGTAAIHMALQLLDVSKGDEVLCQSFTFSASANPIIYQGATPVFIDSESCTWNMSPELLEIAIQDRIEKYKKPKAIIAVHLYGMPYKANDINAIAKKYGIPVIEDSAEALGSRYFNQECGALSDMGILSFNGNKIITTSGGGALIVDTEKLRINPIIPDSNFTVNDRTICVGDEVTFNLNNEKRTKISAGMLNSGKWVKICIFFIKNY